MKRIWQNYVTCGGGFHPESRHYRRAYLINAMLLAALANFGLFTLLNLLVFDLLAPGLLNLFALIGSLSVAVYFRHSRNIAKGGFYTTVIIGFALISYLYIEQHYQYSLFWLATFPPFAYFLNGLKRGSYAIALVFLPVYWLLLTGLDRWEPAPYNLVSLSNIVVASFALTLLVYFYEKSRHEAVAKLRHSKAREAIEKERNRLLREMHDGLGAQLTTALYAAKGERASINELAEYLQQALDDLRMMMDSLQTFDGDVATLLGQLRYRMERRLQNAGLELIWRVDDLPDFPGMTPQDALNLQRIVQEALVNVIKHAAATRVELSARMQNLNTLRICISDNGRGLNEQPESSGRGLNNLHHRATELNAELSLGNNPSNQGCRVTLLLPIRHLEPLKTEPT